MEGGKEIEVQSGIPKALFIHNVEEFLKQKSETVESILRALQDNYSKYKWIEVKLTQSKEALKNKLPDIQKTLEMVTYLSENAKESGVNSHFELSPGLYANATLKNINSVCLWLGANVMVEYSFDEALLLLTRNLEAAKTNLSGIEAELNFLKDQITTTEVNIARVYNFDVKQRRRGGGGTPT